MTNQALEFRLRGELNSRCSLLLPPPSLPCLPTASNPSSLLIISTAPPSSAAAASRLISLLSRPRFSIPIALCFFFLFTTAFVHPSSPVSLRGAQPLYISPYQGYPPSLPDRLASSGWGNGTEGGGASWEGRRKANAVSRELELELAE